MEFDAIQALKIVAKEMGIEESSDITAFVRDESVRASSRPRIAKLESKSMSFALLEWKFRQAEKQLKV